MGATARRAIKGYTYQQSVFALFLSIMDTERSIAKITVEALNTKNFDDIYLECVSDGEFSGKTYRVQAKNYSDATTEDISITEHILSIKRNDDEFSPSDNNILIVNTTHVGASSISLAPTFLKVRARSRRCSSFPNHNHFVGL